MVGAEVRPLFITLSPPSHQRFIPSWPGEWFTIPLVSLCCGVRLISGSPAKFHVKIQLFFFSDMEEAAAAFGAASPAAGDGV